METLSDLTLERLEIINIELQEFRKTSAYEALIESLVGKNAVLEKEVILRQPESILDLFNREASIGEARESARQIDFFDDFLDEVSSALKEKQAPSM